MSGHVHICTAAQCLVDAPEGLVVADCPKWDQSESESHCSLRLECHGGTHSFHPKERFGQEYRAISQPLSNTGSAATVQTERTKTLSFFGPVPRHKCDNCPNIVDCTSNCRHTARSQILCDECKEAVRCLSAATKFQKSTRIERAARIRSQFERDVEIANGRHFEPVRFMSINQRINYRAQNHARRSAVLRRVYR